jgi:hypothetical protein
MILIGMPFAMTTVPKGSPAQYITQGEPLIFCIGIAE